MNRLLFVTMVAVIGISSSVWAQSGSDVFDRGSGGGVSSYTNTEPIATGDFIIDGVSGRFQQSTVFADANGPAGTVDIIRVGLTTANTIRAVDLFVLADGGVEDGFRGVSHFRLLANTGTGFNHVLVDDVNPRDDGAANRYAFEPVTVFGVEARFTRATAGGPRVVELDGILVPEPASAATWTLAAGAALLRRRRRCR